MFLQLALVSDSYVPACTRLPIFLPSKNEALEKHDQPFLLRTVAICVQVMLDILDIPMEVHEAGHRKNTSSPAV